MTSKKAVHKHSNANLWNGAEMRVTLSGAVPSCGVKPDPSNKLSTFGFSVNGPQEAVLLSISVGSKINVAP